MMGFGSEDLQRNGGHYNPPGGAYQSSELYAKPAEDKWGSSRQPSSASGLNVGGNKPWGAKPEAPSKRYEEEYKPKQKSSEKKKKK